MRPRNHTPQTTLDRIIFKWDHVVQGYSAEDFNPGQTQGVISLEEVKEVVKGQNEHANDVEIKKAKSACCGKSKILKLYEEKLADQKLLL